MNKEFENLSPFIYFNEYLGTFILATGISASIMIDKEGNHSNYIPILVFCLYTSIIQRKTMGGDDFNPGVILLKYLVYKEKKKNLFISKTMLNIMIMQLLGAISAFLTSYYLNNKLVFKLAINNQVSQANAFVMEIFASFCLYFVTIYQDDLTNDSSKHPAMRTIISISAVGFGIAMGGKVSGAGMNPAIGFGANFVRFLLTGDIKEMRYTWIYILGPFIGCLLTAYFYLNVYKNKEYYINDSEIKIQTLYFLFNLFICLIE